ncbi:hypothetical protein OG876_00415 [Kribbella sp. NBC_00359]
MKAPPERLEVDTLVVAAAGRRAGRHQSCVGGRDLERWGLQPWRTESFKFSTDPELEAKVRDVVGLYLNPPESADRVVGR